MKKYLTEQEFKTVSQHLANGEASIVVPRRVSRQFFTRVPTESIRATTGRFMLLEKTAIWVGVLAAPALLVICIGAVIYYFDWFAALAVPIVGMFWTVIAGLTGDKGEIWYGIVGLTAGLLLAWLLESAYGIPMALFTVSLFIHRITYEVAELWLTDLVSSSFGAYDMLVEHIELEDELLPEAETAGS